VAIDDGESETTRSRTFLYVPGRDPSGRHDAYLGTDANAAHPEPMRVRAGDEIYAVRLNRVRERGRGWALVGFEVMNVQRIRTCADRR
jgi:hypothetical protein